jgi:hypothetical protein
MKASLSGARNKQRRTSPMDAKSGAGERFDTAIDNLMDYGQPMMR